MELDDEREAAIEASKVARKDAEQAYHNAELERKNAETERLKAEKEKQEKLLLAEKLRELGINPDDLLK